MRTLLQAAALFGCSIGLSAHSAHSQSAVTVEATLLTGHAFLVQDSFKQLNPSQIAVFKLNSSGGIEPYAQRYPLDTSVRVIAVPEIDPVRKVMVFRDAVVAIKCDDTHRATHKLKIEIPAPGEPPLIVREVDRFVPDDASNDIVLGPLSDDEAARLFYGYRPGTLKPAFEVRSGQHTKVLINYLPPADEVCAAKYLVDRDELNKRVLGEK